VKNANFWLELRVRCRVFLLCFCIKENYFACYWFKQSWKFACIRDLFFVIYR